MYQHQKDRVLFFREFTTSCVSLFGSYQSERPPFRDGLTIFSASGSYFAGLNPGALRGQFALIGLDRSGLLKRQTDIIQAVQQAVFLERVYGEGENLTIR